MAYRRDEVGALLRKGATEEQRAEAAKRILLAFNECNGMQSHAADLLNVTESTLIRWVRVLNLRGKVDEVRERAKNRGAYVRGRPKKRMGWKRKAGW